ncbi:hypothetical protein ACYJ1Y_12980 [Natrialbaceae archaeon A-gly3]
MTDFGRVTSLLALVLGAALVVLGTVAYVITDFASVTALIPAFFGAVFVLLGGVALWTDRRRPALYGIAALGVLGALGSTRGLGEFLTLLSDGSVDSTTAAITQGVMFIFSLLVAVAAIVFVLDER